MILKTRNTIERQLNIFEYDFVNNEEILILTAYAIKKDSELWEFPTIQKYNVEAYEKNKEAYEEEIIKFRNNCSLDSDKISLIESESQEIKEKVRELENLVQAITLKA